MKRLLVLLVVTLPLFASEREASMRALEEGRALLEKLQKGSSAEQAIYASRVKAAFEKAVELDPSNVDARLSLAGYYINAPFIAGGSYKKARKEAAAIIELDPLRGHLLMAEIHGQEKEWPQAEAALQRALAVEPNNAEAYFSLGRMQQEQERWTEAAAAFEKVVALDPEHGQAWYQIGRTSALSGRNLDRGLEALDLYLARFAEKGGTVFHAGAWWRRGEIREKQGELEDAAAAYRNSLAIRRDLRVEAALAGLERRSSGR